VTADGQVWTRVPLDRENTSMYEFYVYAIDHGTPSCTSSAIVQVTVTDVNDNAPVFCYEDICGIHAMNSSSVVEKSPIHSVVALPVVKDADSGSNGEVRYELSATPIEAAQFFDINTKSGLVTIKRRLDIAVLVHAGILSSNEASNATLNLYIIAVDQGSPQLRSNVTLNVAIEPLNNEVPVFTKMAYHFNVSENRNGK
jgi:hypothetical protein